MIPRPGGWLDWARLAALLGGASLAVTLALSMDGGLAPEGALARVLDWQPGLDIAEPWRPWTSALVHWSWPHLAVNLVGAAVVAGVGWRARTGGREVVAWLLAWPLTQALLDVGTALAAYGGLSGVLHAGVVIVGLGLVFPRRGPELPPAFARRHRRVGAALCLGTLAKVWLEAPWGPALRPSAALGIDVAPLAHACGLVAGVACWTVCALASRGKPRA